MVVVTVVAVVVVVTFYFCFFFLAVDQAQDGSHRGAERHNAAGGSGSYPWRARAVRAVSAGLTGVNQLI